ncbi:hypothetical protein EDD17DRAFT_364942 [Pisolithus thermaeus]|nr:hypothetical protein EDD17DRAFT_364942 [Pisolithus thermaeus]
MASTDDVSREREELERCPPGHHGHDVALFYLAYALHDRFMEERKIDDLNEAITLHRDALKLRPVENETFHRSSSFYNLALCLSHRHDKLGAVDDLEEAIALGQEALALCPPGHPHRDVSLYNLGFDLRKRFVEKGEICDLEEAIKLYRAALELRPPGHPERSSSLYQFVLCLSSRYESQRVVDDLEEVVTLRRAELELCPREHPDHHVSLHNLACDLRRRFAKTAAIHDLEESIKLHRAALELRSPGHTDRSSTLHELSLCLSNRHEKLGVIGDLEEAITIGREASKLRPSGHPDRCESLHNLACNLRKRFVIQTVVHDLEEAMELHRAVSELRPSGHPEQSSTLHELALCLSNRHDKLGLVNDLEEAIMLGRTALELCPPRHPDNGKSLQNLAHDLRKRFVQKAAICDLEESIELLRPALELRPIGHPDRSSSLYELALCLSHRHDKYGEADDLEEAILLGRTALELCPPWHPDRGMVLYNLACDFWKKFQFLHQAATVAPPTSRVDLAFSLCEFSQHLWDQFQKQAMTTDLDNAIRLATYALELRLPPEHSSVGKWVQRLAQEETLDEPVMLSGAVDNLCALANYLRARFQTQHAIVDLNEAITLCRYVLQFRPIGHPDRASSLHYLAQCLADRFRQQLATVDLDDAIALEQEALQLLVHEDPGYDTSRQCLTACLQIKFNSQVVLTSLDVSGVTHLDIEQVIRNAAFEILKTMPIRLLHTPTGILCNRDQQVSDFMKSKRYKRLVSLYGERQQMELIYADISRHFQFVTLSHRWGEGEPSLRDIEGHTIYGMSIKRGFGKLQAFCRVALELNYLWAWSDTCCIDRHSSAEVQETIGSMFTWYRQSALTIIYLSDVPDTGLLGSSEWLRRGWTLQELLAPRNVLFYTEDWSPYKNLVSSNHKTDVAVLEELERETGIEPRFLTNFSPGLDDARSRLQWASLRRTTRPEDIAYSLFGIFNLHLPVMYGESAENALGRLLAEIVSHSGDISVLDWVGEPSPFHSCFPAHITAYGRLPTPPPQPTTEEQSSEISEGLSSFDVLRNISGLPVTVPAGQLRIPDSYAPGEVYDFHSLARVPLPRFFNRLLTLPCIAYHVTTIQLKGSDLLTPNYTYNIQATGLIPLEIAMRVKLEDVTGPQGILYLVRPWHSELLGPSAELDAVTDEQLVSALERPLNALLLTQLPHNEHKRIASSTFITAQPMDRASILNSKISIFNVV